MSKQSRKHNRTVGTNAEYRRAIERAHGQPSFGTGDGVGSYDTQGAAHLEDAGCQQLTLAEASAKGTVAAKTPQGGGQS